MRHFPDLPGKRPHDTNVNPITRSIYSSSSLLRKFKRGHGILTVCPSHAPFGICLGPTNPWLIVIAKETWGFRRSDISSDLRLLVPTFSLLPPPLFLTDITSTAGKCSPTVPPLAGPSPSVPCLVPIIFGAKSLDE